ncbi:MAG: glycosyltransferase family 2 protein [Ruminococcus sp.]|nr:glycosyltransferase family 2 protein [Ruminococcus sp.]
MLSIIIPSYNEEKNIEKTFAVVTEVLEANGIDFEIIFINDGSSDSTWQKISDLAHENDNVTSVDFSRNFGKESAIFAGLEIASGDACVLMDCDLQHPPETIIEMYNIWKNNDVDIVEGRKKSRGKESKLYKCFSMLFYRILNKSSGLDMDSASDFKLLDRKVVDALNKMPERLTFFRAMSSWVGFRTEKIYFEVAERQEGKSKWSARSLFRYAINSITSFTSAPLHLVTVFGIISFIISVVLGIDTLYNKIWGNSEAGFPTVIILQLLTTSIIMFSLGIIGYYISKIYEEIKNRPRYIITKIVKKDKEEQ